MYARKPGRPSAIREQTRDVLVRIMHAKQPGLQDHSNGVARLAVAVGRRLGMDAEQIDELARAAELHDVGKVGIPDAILDKAGPLSDREREFVHQHTLLGERILSAAPALRPVATIVRATHERWDGSGYPDGLAGEQIPLGARIIAACDAYEAMTTDRCDRGSMSHQAACEELRREAGRQFDARVVEVLIEELHSARHDHVTGERESVPASTATEVAAYLRAVLARQLPSQAPVGVAPAEPREQPSSGAR